MDGKCMLWEHVDRVATFKIIADNARFFAFPAVLALRNNELTVKFKYH